MWIRTQDKKEIVNISRFKITPIYGSKIKKARISGYVSNVSSLTDYIAPLGDYASMEEAISEMDNIQEFILKNPISVYEMTKSK